MVKKCDSKYKHKKKKSPKILNYEIAQFRICNENFANFTRLASHDKDCVINALELLKIVDKLSAGIMRIIVEPGKGIGINTLQNIFSFLYQNHLWVFRQYNNLQILVDKITTKLMQGYVVFCGITYPNGNNHVFLIGLDIHNRYSLIDPQIALCFLSSKECYDHLLCGTSWYILEATN